MKTDIGNALGWKDWERKKNWIEDREPDEPSAFHIAEAIWDQGLEAWLAAYSEYVRVKEAAIGGVWDAECILWFIEIHQSNEIERRFGSEAFSLLQKRVQAERSLPIDPAKVENAKEFCRPFEDYYRVKVSAPELAARSEKAMRKLAAEMFRVATTDPSTY